MLLASADFLVFAAGALTGAAVIGLIVMIPAYAGLTRLRQMMKHRDNALMGEFVSLSQKMRQLSLAQLLVRGENSEADLTADEGSVSSQNGEDGILLGIVRRIGIANRFFVEIGAQTSEANCLLLADAFGWAGVFFEADEMESESLRRKYAGIPIVKVVGAFVTRENINSLMDSAGVPDEFDIMSIDIDGNDYWVFEALDRVRPRIVVIEINSSLPPGKKLVQPYRPDRGWDKTDFYGASLDAMRDLMGRKGYRLVHVEVTGNNAFFVREELVSNLFPIESEVSRRAVNNYFRGRAHRPRDAASKFLDLDGDATTESSQPKPG